MAKTESMRTLAAILAPEDEEPRAATAAPAALPGLEERVDLFLRAVHGPREATASERAAARLRILDAMAADFAGEPDVQVSQSEEIASAPFLAAAAPPRSVKAAGPSVVSGLWDTLRDALLWPLTMASGQPMRLVGVACAVLLVAGGGWTGTWFYAAHRTETAIASLISSEANAGRDYSCGSRSVGGFPLHVEVTCTALQATVAMSSQSTMVINAKSLTTVASIFHPDTYVTEISGPVSITDSNQSATVVGNWALAQLTLNGKAADKANKVSLVLDNPEIYRVAQGKDKPLLAGGRLELDAATTSGSDINIAARAIDVSVPQGGPITSRPFVANIAAVLRNPGAQSGQSLAETLRDWQSRGGHIDVAEARIQQGDALATGSGHVGLNLNGGVEGSVHLDASGPYRQLAQSYLRDGNTGAREREQLAQAYFGQPRVQTRSLGASPDAPAPARPLLAPAQGGKLEIPIRFVNGAVYLGSTGLGAIPPLF